MPVSETKPMDVWRTRLPGQPLSHRRVLMISPVNMMRAYSSFQYLADALSELDATVDVLAAIPREIMNEARQVFGKSLLSYRAGWQSRVPKGWRFLYRRNIKRLLTKRPNCILLYCTSPTSLTPEIINYKTKNPQTKLVLFCPEIWLPDEPVNIPDSKLVYFQQNIRLADLVIDVDATRAELRRKHFSIDHAIPVLPNTAPKSSLPDLAQPGKLRRLAGLPSDCQQKLLLFTGPARKKTINELMRIVQSVSPNVTLVWFVHGDEVVAQKTQAEFDSSIQAGRVKVIRSVPRVELLSFSYQADAGLIVYPFREIQTTNQKFASPSKLYEFLARGLPVVSYPNPSIQTILNKYDVGVCSKLESPESLAQAINSLFDRDDLPQYSERCEHTFNSHLCHEVAATDALVTLVKLISAEQ